MPSEAAPQHLIPSKQPEMRTIPEPNKHLVRFYGVYANRVRSEKIPRYTEQEEEQDEEASHRSRALSKRWAELIYRIYENDPLTCRRCGEKMNLLAFIIDPAVIRCTLDHLETKARPKAPPKPYEITIL